jgi:uncharacterized membrane protein HdeD (DUF308 family)
VTTIPAAATPTAMDRRRTLTVRGALLLLFGLGEATLLLMAFRLPDVTASVLVDIMVAFFLLDGLAIVFDFAGATARHRGWLLLIAEAIASIGAGVVIALVAPSHALSVFGGWALVMGLLETVDARPVPHPGAHRVVAASSMVFGALVLWGPGADLPRLVLAVGVYGIIAGLLKLRAAVH